MPHRARDDGAGDLNSVLRRQNKGADNAVEFESVEHKMQMLKKVANCCTSYALLLLLCMLVDMPPPPPLMLRLLLLLLLLLEEENERCMNIYPQKIGSGKIQRNLQHHKHQ